MRSLPLVGVAAFSFLCSQAHAAGPWAETVRFEPLKDFGTVTIPNGEKPVYKVVEFPAVVKKPGTRVVLRFRSRLHYDRPSGWNYYLGINLNGTQVSGFTPNGTPRLINRGLQVTLDEGRPYTWPWWNRVPGGAEEISLLTFFGPGGTVLDKRIKSDRQELYWFVVDVDDVANYLVKGLDDVVVSNKPNKLVLSNGLIFRFVKGRKCDLILNDFALGTIPATAWKGRTRRYLSKVSQLANPVTLSCPDFEVKIGRSGAMHVLKDGQVFGISSAFSAPGERIRSNALAQTPDENQHESWRAVVVKRSATEAVVKASCPAYALERAVRITDGRITVRDTFKNTRTRAVGIRVEHRVTAPQFYAECLIGGVPELSVASMSQNPTLFLRAESACLGVLAEDNILRLQLNAVAQPNRAVFKVGHFGIAPGKSYAMEWALYPFEKTSSYWTFVNRIRNDWNVNFTIQGSWDFFHVQSNAHLLEDPDRLRRYLKRKNLKIVALMPWLDYENYDRETGGLINRDKYKRLMVAAARAFRAVDPSIKVTGCLESFPIGLSLEDARTLRDRLPNKNQGYPLVTKEMLKGLKGLTEREKDSLFVNPEGKFATELYYRGGGPGREKTPMAALAAYPVIGNAQHDRLMEQARFLKEECGLDGIYIDCFSMAYSGSMAHMRYDYSKWDGHTVDIDPNTGRVTRRYTDAGFVGAESRAALIRYVLQGDGVFVANSYAAVRETQSLPAFRFSESEYCFNPLDFGKGQEPPLFYRMCGGQLSTPIGLGYRVARLRPHGTNNYARIIMKSVITYLRYGGLYYYYNNEIPETGPGAGSHGPINHMYPITPVELGEGFIVGKERTITAVSGTYQWKNPRKPTVLVFDITGRPTETPVEMKRTGEGWSVTLKLEDWENVGVIE